jgi:hypothetical protein
MTPHKCGDEPQTIVRRGNPRVNGAILIPLVDGGDKGTHLTQQAQNDGQAVGQCLI